MGWLAFPAGALLLAGVVVLILGVFRRRAAGAAATDSVAAGDAAQRMRAETALRELRDMREALGPATHNRVERRRTPQPGAAPKIERRKKGGGRPAPGPE